jgi:hypothetical protein
MVPSLYMKHIEYVRVVGYKNVLPENIYAMYTFHAHGAVYGITGGVGEGQPMRPVFLALTARDIFRNVTRRIIKITRDTAQKMIVLRIRLLLTRVRAVSTVCSFMVGIFSTVSAAIMSTLPRDIPLRVYSI